MYESLLLPWSSNPSLSETLYRSAGLVKTKGTVFLLPPSPATLRATFNAPPRPQTRMSAGAVALCKHFERGGASSEHGRAHPFWTLPTGSNENKTAVAAGILEEMLRDARWRNVMILHQGVAVFEVRNGRGYGMRWTLELERKSQDDDHVRTGDGEGKRGDDVEMEASQWSIKRTTFRGFLEPIVEMDHELDIELS